MFEKSRFNLSRWAIEYSRLTICFWLAIAVAGIFAFSSLKYSLFPAVNFPVVVIRAQSSAADSILATETKLTNPLENTLIDTSKLKQLFSSTYSGQTVINILFDTDISLDDALVNVETNLEQLSLPEDVELEVIPFNLNETSAISYVVTNEQLDLTELSRITSNSIIPVVEQISGVQRVDILGNSGNRSRPNISASNSNSLIHFNGQQAIAFQVIKQSDANTLEVVRLVEQQIAQLKQ